MMDDKSFPPRSGVEPEPDITRRLRPEELSSPEPEPDITRQLRPEELPSPEPTPADAKDGGGPKPDSFFTTRFFLRFFPRRGGKRDVNTVI